MYAEHGHAEKAYINMLGFTEFIKKSNLINCSDSLLLSKYFNLSLNVQTNELNSDNHTKIRHKFEFIEAIAR